jgi:hypothetical protein
MKVEFTDTFAESLKRLAWHESGLYKAYSLFRYDLPRFFKNTWRFRKVLWNHQWWDYRFTLETLHTSLTIMEKGMSTKGMEVPLTRDKKVSMMRRSLWLLQNKMDDNFIERAEEELGKMKIYEWEFEKTEDGNYTLKDQETPEEKEHSRKVFARAREIEEIEWAELWNIFKGQDPEEWKKIQEKLPKNKQNDWDPYEKWYDGSDLRGWWD